MKIKNLICVLVVSYLALLSVPVTGVNAVGITEVTVAAPANVPIGGTFIVRLNVAQATNFNAFQFQLNYNPNIIQVVGAEGGPAGVSSGLIGSTSVLIDHWNFYPAGTPGAAIRILGRIPGNQGVSGSGYLAELHFIVIGSVGQSTALVPTGTTTFINGLFDNNTIKITTGTPWSPASVRVSSLAITTSSLPDGTVGVDGYSATLAAANGTPSYTWSATGLPGGLSLSSSGVLSAKPQPAASDYGKFTLAGNKEYSGTFMPVFTVIDSTGNNVSQTLPLTIKWKRGDASGDGIVTMAAVTKVERIILWLDPSTPGADANGDGQITMTDVTTIERIILGLNP